MLFDLPHILFMVGATVVISVLLVIFGIYIKSQKIKNLILLISALLTIIIHFSTLYTTFFKTGVAKVEETMLLPIYPCNIAMWLLLISALLRNKQSKFFKIIAECTFYLGIVGGILGIVLNEIYASTPNLADWGTLKGLLSHTTMLFGAIYLLVGKYIKVRVNNLISITIGLLYLMLDGWIIIGIYKLFKLNPPNSMYLLQPPFEAAPWFNTYLIGAIAIILFFTITAIVEQIALKKEERWYYKIKLWYNEFKLRRKKQ